MDEENKVNEIKEEEAVKEESSAGSEAEEAVETPPEADTGQEEKPLEKMTTPELKDVALEIPGVTGVTAMKKDQLLALIKEYRGITDEEPKKKKKATLKGESIRDLKRKVVTLREDKKMARDEKDRKKVDIIRRRINRLKKRTRKVGRA